MSREIARAIEENPNDRLLLDALALLLTVVEKWSNRIIYRDTLLHTRGAPQNSTAKIENVKVSERKRIGILIFNRLSSIEPGSFTRRVADK